jgi:hypothetical protein
MPEFPGFSRLEFTARVFADRRKDRAAHNSVNEWLWVLAIHLPKFKAIGVSRGL